MGEPHLKSAQIKPPMAGHVNKRVRNIITVIGHQIMQLQWHTSAPVDWSGNERIKDGQVSDLRGTIQGHDALLWRSIGVSCAKSWAEDNTHGKGVRLVPMSDEKICKCGHPKSQHCSGVSRGWCGAVSGFCLCAKFIKAKVKR